MKKSRTKKGDDNMATDPGKKVLEEIKKSKQWHHDIRYIEGEFVEHVVKKFQITKNEKFLTSIIENYSIFRNTWAKAFAPYLDNDLEAGKIMHDEIIWKSVNAFCREKVRKPDGRAFNAYLVSALLNQLKNHRNSTMSHKNHPRVQCPVCGEEVYQIDSKHLRHVVDLERYRKLFPGHPLSSPDGSTCLPSGERVPEISKSMLNKSGQKYYYTVADFKRDYAALLPRFPIRCPITGQELIEVSSAYPSMIMKGYTEEEFLRDYPDFAGAIKCPFSGKKLLEVTQQYLDTVLGQDPNGDYLDLNEFAEEAPYPTLRAKRVDVLNPYTKEKVTEIALSDLVKSGTTWKEHLEAHAQTWLDKQYPFLVYCPFTGRKTHMIRKKDVLDAGKTVQEFYAAVCKYPLRKWAVRCALCGEWVSNIWEHLDAKEHNYAPSMSSEDFEKIYATGGRKAIVTSNSYVQNDSGDLVHLADLFGKKRARKMDMIEIEDSLMDVAEDEIDKKLAAAVREAHTLEDVFYTAAHKEMVELPFAVHSGMTKMIREAVRAKLGVADFDIAKLPEDGKNEVTVMLPSRDTMRRRLTKMIEESDLE